MKDTTVAIPKFCCADGGCRRVSTHAWKLSDFWLSACTEHHANARNTTFSINRALEQLKGKS